MAVVNIIIESRNSRCKVQIQLLHGKSYKFHYTDPTGRDPITRPGSDKVRGLCLVGSGRARVVEFSYKLN